MNLRVFFRLQTDSYLTALRDQLALDITQGIEYTSLSLGGKSTSQRRAVKIATLVDALVPVLLERGLGGNDYVEKERMTTVRFV